MMPASRTVPHSSGIAESASSAKCSSLPPPSARGATAPSGGPRFNFARGLVWATMVKEWRLIARDTRLLTIATLNGLLAGHTEEDVK